MKDHPEHGLRLADALSRAELPWSDLTGMDPAMLEAIISNLESAAASKTPTLIERALRELEQTCYAFHAGQRW